MTTKCDKCGANMVFDDLATVEIRYNGINKVKRVCRKCAFLVDEFTDLAFLPDKPKRSRLDALYDYVEREKSKTPKEKVSEVVTSLYRKGYTIGAIAKETGISPESVMLILIDAEGVE